MIATVGATNAVVGGAAVVLVGALIVVAVFSGSVDVVDTEPLAAVVGGGEVVGIGGSVVVAGCWWRVVELVVA